MARQQVGPDDDPVVLIGVRAKAALGVGEEVAQECADRPLDGAAGIEILEILRQRRGGDEPRGDAGLLGSHLLRIDALGELASQDPPPPSLLS